MVKNNPSVSIIITAHNYGKYLGESLKSALNQNFNNYEVVVVDDGSTDNTQEIIRNYKKQHPNKIKMVTLDGVGLSKACNKGVEKSSGKYIVRLDADDYFDENILLIEATYLENHSEIDLVYPDYFEVDKEGNLINYKRLMKIGKELKTFDRCPLAIGAMYRRECYDEIGGYDESLKHQEDYDFWVRFTKKFKAHTINLPLMYYRQHGESMSTNLKPRMKARRKVKNNHAEGLENKKVLGIIPARAKSRVEGKLALRKVGDKTLIQHTIEEGKKAKHIDKLIVSTDDEEIAEEAKKHGTEVPFIRPKELAGFGVGIEAVVEHALTYFKKEENWEPDIVAILHVPCPFKTGDQIDEAIDTLALHDKDTVISVTEDKRYFWKPGMYGLEPLTFRKRHLKKDRETMYRENGAIYVFKTENLKNKSLFGDKIGNIIMYPDESLHIENEFDLEMANKMAETKNE